MGPGQETHRSAAQYRDSCERGTHRGAFRRVAEAAVSTFSPVQFFRNRASVVEVALDTGRTHQIRVHAAHVGHPVAGDEKYGDKDFNARMREEGLTRMFLQLAPPVIRVAQ